MSDIKNGDMPVNPLSGDAYIDFESAVNKNGSYNPECQGLTKREAFAMAAMQGILSGGLGAYDEYVKVKCKVAVEYSDALLKELSK